MSLPNALNQTDSIVLKQRFEMAELIGFETRNKYAIHDSSGKQIGFAAEQQKGILGFLFRQFLGHWRRFNLSFFDLNRELVLQTRHPFRFFFQRLEVNRADGTYLGAIQQRFAILSKKFDLQGPHGEVLMTMRSPLWRIWTFPIHQMGREVARIEKKWSGALTELFTDKDSFRVSFLNAELAENDRLLLLAAAVFVDLQYFEAKAD